ncbi:AraC family transcriptional regulator [Chryseolinea soli]|nr:AraC family transcriptional regulator [Chryseolinea soli]
MKDVVTHNFSKNHVFFSTTRGNYHYPTHETPHLLVANFRESGQYVLNTRKVTASDSHFYMLNPGDKLEIDLRKKHALQTFLIAFDQTFVTHVFQTATSSAESLLDDGLAGTSATLSVPAVPFLMNAHISDLLYSTLQSSQEDEILAEILLGFFPMLHDTRNRLENLKAIKRSTREEIYRRIFVAEEFMREHLSETISLDQIAAAACMNRFHFLKLFKEMRHMTPHHFLTSLRLEQAYQQLKAGRFSVTEVCYAAGFQSPASFSHLFKRRYGCVPSALRK